jgi:hypothetical protein
MIRRKRKGAKISVKRIRRFMAKTGTPDALENDLEQAETHLGSRERLQISKEIGSFMAQ